MKKYYSMFFCLLLLIPLTSSAEDNIKGMEEIVLDEPNGSIVEDDLLLDSSNTMDDTLFFEEVEKNGGNVKGMGEIVPDEITDDGTETEHFDEIEDSINDDNLTTEGVDNSKLAIIEAKVADDFRFETKIASGFINYDYSDTLIGATSTYTNTQGEVIERKLSSGEKNLLVDNIPFVGIGAAIRWNRWVGDVYMQRSSKGQDQYLDVGVGSYADKSFRFTDYSAAISYEIFSNLSLSVGYKRSTLESTERLASSSASTDIPKLVGLQKFTTYGPSVGSSYNWRLNEDMSIGLGVSYGWLKGEREERSIVDSVPSPTSGISFGLSFNHKIPRSHFKYSISLDGYKYDTKSETNQQLGSSVLTSTYEIEQSLNTLKATLIYEF